MSIPELLSPAGSMDALVSAVHAGADAVYLSGTNFSARKRASNFTAEELKEALALARSWGVRTYLAVNTLMFNSELKDVMEYIAELYSQGADALILQDMGLAGIVRETFPDLPLHASTQASVDGTDGVRLMRHYGFRRVIADREATADELGAMCSVDGIGVEAFVHGALCMSYSGQCLFSSIAGGRSGNRGLCSQPCRNRYLVGDRSDHDRAAHWLSPLDLNLSSELETLVSTGVCALKIEGRLKTSHYVHATTSVYRDLLDQMERGEAPVPTEKHVNLLKGVFNRGFTSGYLHGWPGPSLVTMTHGAPVGEYLGTVSYVMGKRMLVDSRVRINEGDGLALGHGPEGRTGLVARGVDHVREGHWLEKPRGLEIPKRAPVYRTMDSNTTAMILSLMKDPRRRVPLHMHMEMLADTPPTIEVSDGVNHARASLPAPAQEALTSPLTREDLVHQLNRLGGTPYFMDSLDIKLDPGLFIPLSGINQLRREAIERLDRIRRAPPKRKFRKNAAARQVADALDRARREIFRRSTHSGNVSVQLYVRVSDVGGAVAAAEAGAAVVALPLWDTPVSDLVGLKAKLEELGVELCLIMPHMAGDEGVKRSLPVVKSVAPSLVEATSPTHLIPLEELDDGPGLVLGHSLNITNSLALSRFDVKGPAWLQPSLELTLEQLNGLVPPENGHIMVLAEGVIPQMTSRHCFFMTHDAGKHGSDRSDAWTVPRSPDILDRDGSRKGCPRPCAAGPLALTDRKEMTHSIVREGPCRNVILNACRLSLYKRADSIFRTRKFSPLLDLRWLYTPEEITTMVGAYAALSDGRFVGDEATGEELAAIHGGCLTYGHLFRDVE